MPVDVQGWVVIALAAVLFGYLVPHLVHSRQQLAEARVEDRFSTTLRVVGTGATTRRTAPEEHHGTREGRPYLHDPRRRTEAPAVNRPTTPSERAAAEARRLAAARAARAAEISRRKAAARRRLVLTLVLLTASVAGWVGFGVASMSVALGAVPTALLAVVLVLGRRAAKIAARRNAADRAAMARLELRPEARPRPVSSRRVAGAASAAPSAGASAADGTPVAEETRSSEASPAPDSTDVPDVDEPGAEEAPARVTTAAEAGAPSSDRPSAPAETTTRAAEADADERGWTPVPVPAPSYTLKPAAPRRDIAPYEAPEPVVAAAQPVVESGLAGSPYAAVADPQSEDVAAPVVGPARGLDLDSVLARRRAATA